jgi:arylsulfatase A-like enzyme
MMNELYDVSIHGLDRELGELFGFMQAEGIMDRTCMVITSDHGESIGEHGLIGHDWGVYDCLIKVPLIVRYPEVFPQSTKVTSQVETRRIFHTVIELASRSKGSTGEQDSESLRATLGVNNPNDYAYGEYYPSKGLLVRLEGYGAHIDAKAASMRRFVRSRDLKYVKYENNYCELYDLRNGERRVNPEEFRESASLLNNRLSSWERALRICEAEAKRDAANDSDQSVIEERLRALGYW